MLAMLCIKLCNQGHVNMACRLATYLSTTTHCLDHFPIIKEESARQSHAVRMVGGSILESHIQSLH